MTFGLLVLLLGVLFLLKNLGLVDLGAGVWEIIWPCVLILVGAKMMFLRGGHGRWCHCGECKKADK